MFPDLVLFGKSLPIYTIMTIVGALAALFFLYFESEKVGCDSANSVIMFLFSTLGVAVGGCLLYGITNWRLLLGLIKNLDHIRSAKQLLIILQVIFGGSVFYGGLLGCLGVSFLYLRVQHLPYGPYADLGAVAIPLFHTFGRIGCFLTGCCYGMECPWGVTYHYSPVEVCNGVTRLPVQLVEAAGNLGLFFFLWILLRRGKMKGQLLGLYLVIYPVFRFILEFFRGDTYRGFLLGLSTSQWISLILLTGAAVFFIRQKKKAN